MIKINIELAPQFDTMGGAIWLGNAISNGKLIALLNGITLLHFITHVVF